VEGKPLVGETLWLTGNKRGKSFKGKTDNQGRIIVWLPKGDSYSLNFKYNKNYSTLETRYTKGSSSVTSSYSYLGTKEIELRKKQEAERIALEEKRLKALEKKFAEDCKKLGISAEEGKKREIAKYVTEMDQFSDPVILKTLNRNNWDDKLIVCDLTGSMSPYAAQLSIWYQLHYQKEKNLQFVFFNDGDAKADQDKKIGETGGIYYSPSKGIKELSDLMNKVCSAGSGGDCPENNMEALIKGNKMAAPYKELVMIVDNKAPVKDIALLKNFNRPVHIILCGYDQYVKEDYLLIAWKTKGTIHTIEEDITNIASMSEGQEVIVKGHTYRIMGGEFVRIDKL
jgi:DNA-binding protein H-NS